MPGAILCARLAAGGHHSESVRPLSYIVGMSETTSDTLNTNDVFADPVSFLGRFGIAAELIVEEPAETQLILKVAA